MGETSPQFADYFGRLSGFGELWRTATVRYLAVASKGTWFNALSTIVLRPAGYIESAGSFERDLGPFKFGLMVVDGNVLLSLRDSLEREILPALTPEIHLTSPDLSLAPHGQEAAYRVQWSPFDLLRGAGGAIQTGETEPRRLELQGRIQIMGTQDLGKTWSTLPDLLLGCPEPYLGIEDLSRNFIGYRPDFQYFGSSFVGVSAPLPGLFDLPLSPTSPGIDVALSLPPGTQASDFAIASVIQTASNPRRENVALALPLGSTDGHASIQARVDTRDGLTAYLRLLFRGMVVDSVDLILPKGLEDNPRLAAFEHFDARLAGLRSILCDPTQKQWGERLEEAVGWLLYIAGFQTLHEGTRTYKLSDEEIDFLAFVPGRPKLLTVEVTSVGPLREGKLGKLRDRTDRLASKLPSYDVLPVLVIGKDEVHEAETDQADGLGIVLMTPKMLEELLEAATAGTEPSAIFDGLAQNLPKRESRVVL